VRPAFLWKSRGLKSYVPETDLRKSLRAKGKGALFLSAKIKAEEYMTGGVADA